MELSPPLISLNSAIYSGCGNLFILTFSQKLAADCVPLCQANGTDGLILIEHSDLGFFKFRIFNRDGSEAEMCGNGLRCAVKFFKDNFKLSKTSFLIETMNRMVEVNILEDLIFVSFPFPKTIEPIQIGDLFGYFLDTGVPHTVFFVDDFTPFHLAPSIRHHERFAPKGTNVNFALLGNPISLRTYERGVEGETLSCGTGAVAVALAAHLMHRISSPITLKAHGGDELIVAIQGDKVTLSGPAKLVSVDVYDKNGYNIDLTLE